MKPIISVRHISKRYTLGARETGYSTLREALINTARQPFKKLKTRRDKLDDDSSTLWALKDVSFDVLPGETLGIIGRNGAGKSTLLKVLSRITEPTSGEVDLYGRVGSLLEVGTGFHPELTGRENIYLNGALLGMTRAEIARNFDEIVAFSEIEKFLDTPVKRYSSGMYMRLAFSVAAHLNPEILIVDEVLAVGDQQFQKKCLGKMNDVAKQGRTVIFVSHNMEAVRKLCSKCVLLERGRIDTVGDTEAVTRRYAEGGMKSQSSYQLPPPVAETNPPGYAFELTYEDADGQPTVMVPVGKPWQVRIKFRLTRHVEQFIIAVGMMTSMDAPLRTCWSQPVDLEAGDYEAIFRESKLLLAPGSYSLIIGLSTHERTFHYIENAASIEIADYTEGIDLVRIQNVGILLNPFEVEITNAHDSKLVMVA